MMADSLSEVLMGSRTLTYLQLLLFIVLYLTFFLILNFVITKIKEFRKLSIPFMSKVVVILLSCITVIVLYLNMFISSSYDDLKLSQINFVLQLCYLVILFGLSMYLVNIVKKENRLKYKELQQSQYKEYMVSLEAVNQDMQKFRHDYLNILITMDGYIAKGDLSNLKTYFHNNIVKFEQDTLTKNLLMENVSQLEIIELKGLLLTKFSLAMEKGIDVQVEIPEKINTIPIDTLDFSRILGILIDNAIEASEQSNQPVIEFTILKTTSQNTILVVIENSFGGEVDISQLYKNNYSTKGNDRGYGLSNVSDIVNSYPNVLLHTRVESGRFIQELEMSHRK